MADVRMTPLSALHEDQENPRLIMEPRYRALVKSVQEDPEMLQARPIIALPNGTVIAGNMRLRAARELGWTEIPAIMVDLDPARVRLWQLRDNQEYGEWDEQALTEMLYELAGAQVDLELTGFPDEEIKRLLKDTEPDAQPIDPLPDNRVANDVVCPECGHHFQVFTIAPKEDS